MAPLYDFDCPDHGKFEKRAAMRTVEEDCPVCGQPAPRVFSPQSTATIIPRRFFGGIPRSEVEEWSD